VASRRWDPSCFRIVITTHHLQSTYMYGDVEDTAKGDCIAQLRLERICIPEVEEVSATGDSERGAGGFRSTGR
jgi:hypothetical protein